MQREQFSSQGIETSHDLPHQTNITSEASQSTQPNQKHHQLTNSWKSMNDMGKYSVKNNPNGYQDTPYGTTL